MFTSVSKEILIPLRLHHIRPVLTCDVARAVAASLTQTCLDFANSVLIGTTGSNISKLQRVQNCLASVVLQDNYNSATGTSLLSELHWLPVNMRINFKIATLVYQSVVLVSPLICLRCYHLISLSGPSAQLIRICYLCHAATAVLDKEVFPKIWNDTPLSVRQPRSLDSFKRNLKTRHSANN